MQKNNGCKPLFAIKLCILQKGSILNTKLQNPVVSTIDL